jgi:beta-galactosidase GanA
MPGVIAWQLDNELKGNVSECFCDTCRSLWHKWLLSEYQHIDMLNERWGTHIWSQHYHCFEQVPLPLKTPMGQNPSLVTAYGRFSREMAAVFLKEQAEVIRKDSDLPITHNTSLNHDIDNEKAFDALDFASFDHYSTSSDYGKMLSWMDTIKTLKRHTPFWIMETAPTFSGSIYGYQTIHQNGYIQAEASAAYALGAEGFCYWLWRQHRTGVEQPHGRIVRCGMHRDMLFENSEFSGYKIILTPFLPYLSASFLKKAKAFVAEGGIWIVGPLTGMRTKDQTVHTDAALGELESDAGVKTVFHFPVTGSGVTGSAFGCEAPLSMWSTAFHCIDAKEMGFELFA